MALPPQLSNQYIKQKYRLVGQHSAVKTCHWLRRSLNTAGKEHCYKQKFYGIPCHRCIQMTPTLGHCTQNCQFCWRITPETLGINWEQTKPIQNPEDPDTIVEASIKAHQNNIMGFGGNPKVPKKFYQEAQEPKHAAISLEGEPTLYPKLGELVQSYYNHGFKTVFIVTNGLQPKILANLTTEPSQLYISVCAPDRETYLKTCRPLIPDAWEKLQETLETLNSFKCPTVLRHTLIPKLNMHNPKGYIKQAEKSNATYLEPKAAMSVGNARKRFAYQDMAWHSEIREFAEAIAEASSYNIIDEHEPSQIVLLSQRLKPIKLY